MSTFFLNGSSDPLPLCNYNNQEYVSDKDEYETASDTLNTCKILMVIVCSMITILSTIFSLNFKHIGWNLGNIVTAFLVIIAGVVMSFLIKRAYHFSMTMDKIKSDACYTSNDNKTTVYFIE